MIFRNYISYLYIVLASTGNIMLHRVTLCYRLVVGAPRGNSTYRKHQYIHQPGVVYQCGLQNGGSCVQLIVDPSGKFGRVVNR